jgi:uncharacterized membrane protein
VLEIQRPTDSRHLLQGLLALWPSYLAYALTFLLTGQVWANHHAMFDHIRTSDWILMFCNVLLMLTVAFFPFSASVLAEAFRDGSGARTAVVFYGAAFALGSAFNLIWHHARRARLLGETIDEHTEKALTRRFGLAVPLYLAGTLAGAVLPVLGFDLRRSCHLLLVAPWAAWPSGRQHAGDECYLHNRDGRRPIYRRHPPGRAVQLACAVAGLIVWISYVIVQLPDPRYRDQPGC